MPALVVDGPRAVRREVLDALASGPSPDPARVGWNVPVLDGLAPVTRVRAQRPAAERDGAGPAPARTPSWGEAGNDITDEGPTWTS